MLVDTQPATHQHQPAAPEVRALWVKSKQIGVLMDGMPAALLAGVLSMLVLVYNMANEVSLPGLLVWAVGLLALLVYHYRLIGIYRLRHDSSEGSQRLAFVERYRWMWVALGLFWGAAVLLSFQQATLQTQFVTGLVVLGHAFLTLVVCSAYMPVFRLYAHSLMGSVVLGLLVNTARLAHGLDVPLFGLEMMVLALLFWWLLMRVGTRLNQVHQSNFELQFSNQELIDSLTLQTRAAQRAITAKNRFLASAAHDLRQPVHALSLYADWLMAEPEMGRDIAPRMLQSTRAINELFDSLFDLTRIDAGNYKLRLQEVDVQQLFADLLSQYEPVAAAKSLRLRSRTRPMTLWADPVVLRRMLGNLLSNALRHTKQGGVLLTLRRREGVLAFEVWDTGVGIEREHQQAIFQEFFRVSQHQGTEDSLGLGLTIVSRLATLMGYLLDLTSTMGRGSVFRIMLPQQTQQRPTLIASAR